MHCRPTIIAILACGLFASAASAQVPTYLPQPSVTQPPAGAPTPPQPRSSYDPIPTYTPGSAPTASPPTSTYVPTTPTSMPPPVPTYAPPSAGPAVEAVPTPPNSLPPGGAPNYAAPAYGAPTYSSPNATYPNAPPAPPWSGPAPQQNTAPQHNPVPQQHSFPGYGGAYAPTMPGEMETGTFNRHDFPPGGVQPQPGSCSKWLPTYSKPLWPGSRTPGPTQCYPPTQCGPPSECCPSCSPQKMVCDPCGNWYDNMFVFAAVDAFKNPLDLDGLNGNFGTRAGAMTSFPIWKSGGIGGQVGGSAGLYDWKGSQYTGEDMRYQNFWTAALFHRSCTTGLGFAIGYDWLFDQYFNSLEFGQFRVAASWQINCWNEIGVWAAGPDRRDWATIGTPPVETEFASVMQANAYYRHVYNPGTWMTVFGGLAETPSDISFGVSGQAALNCYMALFGGFEYILPSSGGDDGRQEEIWAMTFGVALYPGSAMRTATSQFRPFLPMADNGNFAIWRK